MKDYKFIKEEIQLIESTYEDVGAMSDEIERLANPDYKAKTSLRTKPLRNGLKKIHLQLRSL
jgi:hypothetical protein